MRLLLRTAAAILGVGSLAASPVPDPVLPASPGGLLIADGGFGGLLEILRHDVRVTINNGIAVTEGVPGLVKLNTPIISCGSQDLTIVPVLVRMN